MLSMPVAPCRDSGAWSIVIAGGDPLMRGDLTPSWTWDRALTGVIPPVISPLDRAGQPDEAAIAALVVHVLGGGCSGLFVLGGCGEGAWLTAAQRGRVVRLMVRAAAGRVPVLAGVMLPATGPAVEAAREAAGEGADAVVVGSPYYFDVEGGAQRRHVEAVLEATAPPRPWAARAKGRGRVARLGSRPPGRAARAGAGDRGSRDPRRPGPPRPPVRGSRAGRAGPERRRSPLTSPRAAD